MKIISLRIKAFGPFKNEENIDFSMLGDKGIYLISGKTGSGKTSIFDAISYALFGTSSGGDRDDKMLRFTGATPDDETFVELRFEYNQKIYRIKRSPSYERTKKRGEGTTEKSKTSVLEIEGEDIIDGNTEVDEYINKLLKIDSDQFSQIVMLAQGNFMKLLKSPSSEKLTLFRNIFSTQKYNDLEKYIGKKFSEKRNEKNLLDNRKVEIYSNIKISSEKSLDFEEVKKYAISEVIEFVQEYIGLLTEKSTNIEEKLLSLEKEKESNNLLLNNVKIYKKTKKDLEETNRELEQISKEFNEVKIKYNDLDKLEENNRDLEDIIRKIKDDIKKFEALEKILKEKKDIERSLLSIKNDGETIKEEINQSEEDIKKYENHIKENKDTPVKLENEKTNLDKLVNKLNSLNRLNDLKIKQNYLSKDKDKNIEKYEDLLKNTELLEKKYKSLDKLFFESQVGIIAKTLKENEACPVCGSKDHPNIYKLEHDIPTEEEVKKSRSNYEKENKELTKIKNVISVIDANIKSNLENIDQLIIDNNFDDIENVEKYMININNKIVLSKNNIEDFKLAIERINYSEEKLDALTTKLKDQNQKLDDKRSEYIRFDEKKNSLEDLEKREREGLKDLDKDKLEAELKNKNEDLEKSKNDIKEIRNNYDKLNTKYSSLQASKKVLEKNLDEKYNKDISEIEEKIESFEKNIKVSRENLSSIKVDLSKNIEQIEKLILLNKEQENLVKEYQNYSDLNEVLKGSISGIANIRFETYVQIRHFEEILVSANKRFHEMTDGKFSLQRKRGANNLSQQSGLDFEVIDHYNKTERDINTLSGGESFQAALSLALGLSDVVQSQSGGIKLDSMFVDEGFGTLDAETLSKVMSSLSGISQFNKLIGIISHVETLKSQIDKQILVSKNQEGYSEINELRY